MPAVVSGCGLVTWESAQQSRGLRRLGQAKVEQRRSALREHDVGRLQITMGDAPAVSGGEGIGDLSAVLESFVERQLSSREPSPKRFPLQALHHKEVRLVLVTDVEQWADVRM